MAIRRELSAEQAERLSDLYQQFAIATAEAGDKLAKEGMDSAAFRAADHKAGEIMEQINRLIGRKTWLG